jgi:hypothetical protein
MNLNEQIQRMKSMMGVINEIQDPEVIRHIYVTEKQILTDEEFGVIKDLFPKWNHFIWIIKKIEQNCISQDEIFDFVDYLNFFDKHKKNFPIKDIGQIKSCDDVKNMINIVYDNSEKIEENINYVIKNDDINKLEEYGILYYGIFDDFQVFIVPNFDTIGELNIDTSELYKVYKNILGVCDDRKKGGKIKLCTVANPSKFFEYILNGYLYVFHSNKNINAPFQVSINKRFNTFECKNKNNDIDEKICEKLNNFISNNISNIENKMTSFILKSKN